ncbi:MAG: hypothetical protein JXB15_12515 [Anaerolineales bacterium]|nr:hypothetical protein [Anaerolineales bacterium]
MKINACIYLLVILLAMTGLACQITSFPNVSATQSPSPSVPTQTATPLLPQPVKPGISNPEEPVFITGEIPYTSPFFVNSISQPFVLLEDEAGFVQRDPYFVFPLPGQAIGPVKIDSDNQLTYMLALPALPQGTFVDVDNDGSVDQGVQIFAIAYWSNIWGDPFLEQRDGTGWSTAYTSAIVDPENDDEIIGGTLMLWAPDDQQKFPTGFGADGKLFTSDDPVAPVQPGYSLADINQEPFRIYKEAQPVINLNEGAIAVNDYSQLSYSEAFQALFDKASREYPFTAEKNIDWTSLEGEFLPRFKAARSDEDFYRALRDFSLRIPDGHVNLSFDADIFYEQFGGSFGLVLAELSDGRIIVTQVIADTEGMKAGIKPGAEILTWNGKPVGEAIKDVTPVLGPYSADHTRRLEQVNSLTRVPPQTDITIGFINPGSAQETIASLTAQIEYDSLFKTIPSFNQDELALPIEANILDESRLGYIRISTFSDDYHLMANLWQRYLQGLLDEDISGLIIDLRANNGGSLGIALDFAGYFFNAEFELYRTNYYNENTHQFEPDEYPARVRPGPLIYDAPIAVLVSPNCVSACEGFAHALQQQDRAIIIGHYPTAGAFGEIGRGQYKLPGDITIQFPTGRSETLDGELLIEGSGVALDITVPVTLESALGSFDAILEAAVKALLESIE